MYRCGAVISRVSRASRTSQGVTKQPVNNARSARDYTNLPHKPPSMNELPQPQGSWAKRHDRMQRKYNLHLAVGIGVSALTLFYVKQSGLLPPGPGKPKFSKAPVAAAAAEQEEEEAPAEAEAVVVEEAPAVAEEAPAVVEEAPAVVEEAPPVVEEAPPVVEEAPAVPAVETPVASAESPVEPEEGPPPATATGSEPSPEPASPPASKPPGESIEENFTLNKTVLVESGSFETESVTEDKDTTASESGTVEPVVAEAAAVEPVADEHKAA